MFVRRPLLVVLVLGVVAAANAAQVLPISVIRYVADGDTFYIDCVPEYKCVNGKLGIRALGLDTPEIRGECRYEIEMARLAKQHLVALKNRSSHIRITPNARRPYDRYNRLLASVSFDDIDWSTSMIDAGLGRVWTGSRGGWCS